MMYAGAQKNIGPAGLTIVIVREDLLGTAIPHTPSMLDYKVHAESGSMSNTPATYAWYIAGLVFQWLKALGGLAGIEKKNIAKAKLLYDFLDSSAFKEPGAQIRPFAHEYPVHTRGLQARRRIPERGGSARHGAAQRPPRRRRHARVDLQRHADRGGEAAGRVHEGVRGEAGVIKLGGDMNVQRGRRAVLAALLALVAADAAAAVPP